MRDSKASDQIESLAHERLNIDLLPALKDGDSVLFGLRAGNCAVRCAARRLPVKRKKEYSGLMSENDFIAAAKNGDLKKVAFSLQSGVDIHAENDKALRWASNHGHEEVVRLLLEQGADVHAESDEALRWASGCGHEAVVRLLLEQGADIHALNDSALQWASDRGHEAVVRLLLDQGADVHAENDEALRWASKNGDEAIVRLLLERGADVHAENDWALRRASKNGHQGCVWALVENGASCDVAKGILEDENTPASIVALLRSFCEREGLAGEYRGNPSEADAAKSRGVI